MPAERGKMGGLTSRSKTAWLCYMNECPLKMFLTLLGIHFLVLNAVWMGGCWPKALA